MAPKKKGIKGKKKKGPPEPTHDMGWEKALAYGKWERPLESLPNPATYSTFGELREKILANLAEVGQASITTKIKFD
eukprot:c19070_g1_i2 orf=179-409(-)